LKLRNLPDTGNVPAGEIVVKILQAAAETHSSGDTQSVVGGAVKVFFGRK
jgi:hypothetical protein